MRHNVLSKVLLGNFPIGIGSSKVILLFFHSEGGLKGEWFGPKLLAP